MYDIMLQMQLICRNVNLSNIHSELGVEKCRQEGSDPWTCPWSLRPLRDGVQTRERVRFLVSVEFFVVITSVVDPDSDPH
jgi:hypothetical protein